MKKIVLVTLILCLLNLFGLIIFSSACYAESPDTIAANNPAIEYTGRIDFDNPLAPKFSYSGVSIRTEFSGTSIAAIMDDDTGQNYYNIILDGKLLDTIGVSVGKKTYNLAQGLENTLHEIEIFKRTEQMFGKTQFFGFVVDNGTTLSSPVIKRDKMIEYIGNSITCGYGDEGVNGGTFGPTTENHYMSFAAITSRNFNARHLAVCKSGIGIYRNYDGPAQGNTDCMTNYYTRTFLYDENPKYSFAERPDLVCIDLGTNDFSTSGCDSAKFVSNYLRLIDTIQTKYAMPDIICLVGPMLSGSSLTTIKRYLKVIMNTANLKVKGNVFFFEMSAQTGDLGIAIDYHPTVAQHKRNALELTEYIKSLKGWKVTPSVIGATIIDAKHVKIEFNTSITDDLNKFEGFTVFGNDNPLSVSKVYSDSTNSKNLLILMKDRLEIGEIVNFSYTPGTLVSSDTLPVGSISHFPVLNDLTETKVIRGSTNTSGTTAILTFNKKIGTNSIIDGLTISDSKGIVPIDSFKIVNTQISLYLKNRLVKADSVFASYSGNGIYGIDEIPLIGFSRLVVKNSSTFTSIEIKNQGSIEIYPNPNSSEKFYYNLGNSKLSENSHIEVYDVNGVSIFNQPLSELKGVINLNGKISKGVYIFKVVNGTSQFTKSIIKK
jgi:hypothetical protein